MLLYIHVPFCSAKCAYCAFSSAIPGPGDFDRYVNGVVAELNHYAAQPGMEPVSTIYFGGGTPSLLPVKALARIVGAIQFGFEVQPDAEWTLEGNPESMQERKYLQSLLALGFNRISLGVQSLNDNNLKALGRVHSVNDVHKAVYRVRSAGFTNLSIDMIWGLPGQRLKLWLDELKEAVAIRPEHLSCYGLTLEPHTPLEIQVSEQGLELPSEDEQGKMFIYGAEFLESKGFIQYEISNFAKMGFQSRHNSGYWDGTPYLGVGPSAVSTIGHRRWQNPVDLPSYLQGVATQQFGADAEELTAEMQLNELVMLGLRTSRGVSMKEYRQRTGKNLVKQHEQLVTTLHKHNLIRMSGGYLRLTKSGMLVSDTIISKFFA